MKGRSWGVGRGARGVRNGKTSSIQHATSLWLGRNLAEPEVYLAALSPHPCPLPWGEGESSAALGQFVCSLGLIDQRLDEIKREDAGGNICDGADGGGAEGLMSAAELRAVPRQERPAVGKPDVGQVGLELLRDRGIIRRAASLVGVGRRSQIAPVVDGGQEGIFGRGQDFHLHLILEGEILRRLRRSLVHRRAVERP